MSEKYVVRLKNAAIYHADNPFGSTSAEKLMRRGEMVLSDVNLCVAPGEFVYLIGRVGSGKSTLLKTLYAEVQLLSGEGRVAGYDLRRLRRRDTFEKAPLDIEGLEGEIKAMLDAIQTNMFEIARAFRDAHTADVHNMEELGRQVDGGYAKAMWCGDQACEDEIKDRFSASSRCMPFDQTPIGETCVCCGKPAKKVIYFAKAY